jgi:hypothetical protein
VNGKKIPDSEKSNYYDLIYGLMESVPAPPEPAIAPAISNRIDPGFPVEPVVAPHPPSPATADMSAVLAPSAPVIPGHLSPHPPMPAIAPMPPDIISDIIRAAFNGDTLFMREGDFVYHFTGKKDKTYKITIKDGVLTELKVDGKKIDKKNFDDYAYITGEIEEEMLLKQSEALAKQEVSKDRQRVVIKNQRRLQQQQDALNLEMQQANKELEKSMKIHEEAMKEHEQAIARHDESERLSKQLISLLNDQLLQDKLIEKGKKYDIKISPEGLFIDGVEQPKQVFERYKKMIEKKAGKPMEFTIQYPLLLE